MKTKSRDCNVLCRTECMDDTFSINHILNMLSIDLHRDTATKTYCTLSKECVERYLPKSNDCTQG